MANIIKVGIVNDPRSDRFQVVAEWDDGTQGPALGSYQTVEQARAGAKTTWYPYIGDDVLIEDWTEDND